MKQLLIIASFNIFRRENNFTTLSRFTNKDKYFGNGCYRNMNKECIVIPVLASLFCFQILQYDICQTTYVEDQSNSNYVYNSSLSSTKSDMIQNNWQKDRRLNLSKIVKLHAYQFICQIYLKLKGMEKKQENTQNTQSSIKWDYNSNNPFNCQHSPLFFYSTQHVKIISQYIFQLFNKEHSIFKGIISFQQLPSQGQIENSLEGLSSIMWIIMENENFYFYYGHKDIDGKVFLSSNREYIKEQQKRYSCIYALMHMKNYLASENFQKPQILGNLFLILQQLGSYYLQAFKKQSSFPDWQKQQYDQKKKWMNIFKPKTIQQFIKMSSLATNSLDFEINSLVRMAIDQVDLQMIGLLLQSRFRIKFIRSDTGENLDVFTIIRHKKQTNPTKLDAYNQIQKKIQFYGHFANYQVQHKVTLLKKSEIESSLKIIAYRLNKPYELFQAFFTLLQKSILGTLNTLQIIASGRFTVSEDNSKKSTIDSIASSIFQKVPIIGSDLASSYAGYRNDQRVQFAKRIIRKLPIDSKEITADYSIRVVEIFCQKIVDLLKQSFFAEVKEYFQKKIAKLLSYNEKQYIFDGQNYSVSWMILGSEYVSKFIEYLNSEQANILPSTIGIRAAFYNFNYHKVSLKQFSKLKPQTEYWQQNALILSKLTSYITEIDKYSNSLNEFGSIYWSDTKLQKEKIRLETQSAIIINEKFAAFLFNSQANINLLKKKTRKCCQINASQQLSECFDQFLDLANFTQTQTNKNASLIKILDRLEKKKDYKIIISGYRLGSVIGQLLHCILVNDYHWSQDSIINYSFNAPLWCHKSSSSYAAERLKRLYSITVIPAQKDSDKPLQDYVRLGKMVVFQTQKKQKQIALRLYIEMLESKESGNSKPEELTSSLKEKDSKADNSDEEADKTYINYTKQYVENDIIQAIQVHNAALFRYIVNQFKINDNAKLNNFLITAIQSSPHYLKFKDAQFAQNVKRSLKIIKFLIQTKKCNPNDQYFSTKSFQSKLTHLQLALSQGNYQISKYLISKGGDLSITIRKGVNSYNSLSLAIYSGNMKLVRYLIEQKKVRIDNLWLEAKSGFVDKEVIYILLKNGADANYTTKILAQTVFNFLAIAIDSRDIRLVRLLLEKGADPNSMIDFSPLGFRGSSVHEAARGAKNLRALKLLFEYGGNIELQFKSSLKVLDKEQYNKSSLDYLKAVIQLDSGLQIYYDVYNYLKILKMQGQIKKQFLEQKEFLEAVDYLQQQDFVYHTISTFYVSQYLYTESLFNKRAVAKNQEKYRKHLDNIRKFLFEGNSKIQKYNSSIRFLYSFHDVKRHQKALKFCNEYPKDQDFIFLKMLIFIQLMDSNSDSPKNKYLMTSIRELNSLIKNKGYRCYIEGQLLYFEGEYIQSCRKYAQSIDSNISFVHPQLKLLKIIAENKGTNLQMFLSKQTIILSRIKNVSTKILPIELISVMDDIEDIVKTEDYLANVFPASKGVEKKKGESPFKIALKQIFSVHPIVIKDRLAQLIPEKVYKLSLTIELKDKEKEIYFTVKSLLKEVNFAFQIMKSHKSSGIAKIFSKKQQPPTSRQSLFFSGIREVINKLQVLRQTIQGKCSQNRDFKNPSDYYECLASISDLVEHYQAYILRVIDNYNKDREENYQKLFFQKVGRQIDLKKQAIIFGQIDFLKGGQSQSKLPYAILKGEGERLSSTNLQSDQMYGTHSVVLLPARGHNQIYFKHKPYAPGLQYAVSALYNLILPNTTPETLLIKVVKGKEEFVYLASAAITGRNFAETINQPQIISTIDIKNFSSLFLCSFLVCTGDSKPDNFVLHFNYDSTGFVSTELVSIDNDIAFSGAGLKVNQSSKRIYAQVLNVLYLLPQMTMPVSPYLKQFLNSKENQPQIIIAKWLRSLADKNLVYLNMKGFSPEELKEMKLPIKLPKGTAAKIYSVLKKIRAFLSQDGITHAEIFEQLSPCLAYFYNKYRDSSSAVNSLKNLYAAAGVDPNIVNSLYSFDKDVNSKAWNTLSSAKRKGQGNFGSIFNSSIRQQAEIFISSIDFKNLDDFVLDTICKQLIFLENLNLKNATQEQAAKIVGSSQRGIKNLKITQASSFNLGTQTQKIISSQGTIYPITTIFDILRFDKVPDRQILLKTIFHKKLNINELNHNGWTILFEIVNMMCNNMLSFAGGEILINILLDCGANPNIPNSNNYKLIDLQVVQKLHPQIIIIILQHQPHYFRRLLREGRIQEAEIIAQSSSMNIFLPALQQNNDIHQDSSILRQIFKDRSYRQLSYILMSKFEQFGTNFDEDLICVFVQNYGDEDVGILETIIKKSSSKASLLLNFKSHSGCPADISLSKKKFGLLTIILNAGGQIAASQLSLSMQLAIKAVKHNIKLDINDVSQKYDHRNANKQGLTVIQLMAIEKDRDIFNYKEFLEVYKESLRKIALNNNFFELIEALFSKEELNKGQLEKGHPLAKNQQTKKLTKLLAKYEFESSLEEALTKINLARKFDEQGNTLLLKMGLKYHSASSQMHKKEILLEIKEILKNSEQNLIQITMRDDGYTILHMAAQWGDSRLAETIIGISKQYCQRLLLNTQFLAPDELAENKELKEMVKIQNIQKTTILQIGISKINKNAKSKCLSFAVNDL